MGLLGRLVVMGAPVVVGHLVEAVYPETVVISVDKPTK